MGILKLTEYYHHAKFDICHIYSDQENHNVKAFAAHGHSDGQTAYSHSSYHASQKGKIPKIIFISHPLIHNNLLFESDKPSGQSS